MLEGIYGQILESAVLPLGDRLEGGGFLKWLRQYRREQWLPAEELRRLSRLRLAHMLTHARLRIPFYRGMPLPLPDPQQDIRQFPIMGKAAVKKHLERLTMIPKEKLVAESGSGSSGIQGTVYMDKGAQASQRAMQMLWFEWSGYRAGDSILQTGISVPRGFLKSTKDIFLKTAYIPAFELDESYVESVLRSLEQRPRKFLFGYASSLFVLARVAVELGFSNLRFDRAVSWGDKLFPHYRDMVRRAFGCETLDTYGCTEGAMVAAQCPEGKYHMSVNQCFVEIVDENGSPVPDGQMGRVLVTRLDNFAMPLIRYSLGDLAAKAPVGDEACGCGRNLPLLGSLIGRDTDIVRTRGGKQMIVHFFTGIFEHEPGIRQFQVLQKDLDGIEIHYIPGTGFSRSTLDSVEKRIRDYLKEPLAIRWIETTFIPPTGSGKPQIVLSLLTEPGCAAGRSLNN